VPRQLRADGQRNRDQVLATAADLIADQGTSVTVRAIAAAAGVGVGTVSRHFPTKKALLAAVLLTKVEGLVAVGTDLLEAGAPDRFERFFAAIVEEGVANRGITEALADDGFDFDAAAQGSDTDVMGLLHVLLRHAQESGAVRSDLAIGDVKRLVTMCAVAEPASSRRLVSVALAGMHR
jgi:AcrR family transcriptional regulator